MDRIPKDADGQRLVATNHFLSRRGVCYHAGTGLRAMRPGRARLRFAARAEWRVGVCYQPGRRPGARDCAPRRMARKPSERSERPAPEGNETRPPLREMKR